MYDSKPSLTTLMKYVDQQFDEKGGKTPLPPDLALTPFQRQAMLAREIELLIERDGRARVALSLTDNIFCQEELPPSVAAVDFFFDNGWDCDLVGDLWIITPGKEGV